MLHLWRKADKNHRLLVRQPFFHTGYHCCSSIHDKIGWWCLICSCQRGGAGHRLGSWQHNQRQNLTWIIFIINCKGPACSARPRKYLKGKEACLKLRGVWQSNKKESCWFSEHCLRLRHAMALSFLTLQKGSIREGERKAEGVCSCLPEGTESYEQQKKHVIITH